MALHNARHSIEVAEPDSAENHLHNHYDSWWERIIPWFLTIMSTIAVVCIAWFLVENLNWFRSHALLADDTSRPIYRIHIHHLHVAMIKRSVGLFSGFTLAFIGTAVVFYTLRNTSTVAMEGVTAMKVSVATASPGILVLSLGVFLILGTIVSKDEFPPYVGEGIEIPDGRRVTVVPLEPEGK